MFEATDCIAILGTRGCGKTTLSKHIQKLYPKVVIIDPVSEYADGEVVDNFDDFAARMVRLKSSKKKKFRLIFRFHPDLENHEVIFNEILRLCFWAGGVQIVMEEVQLMTSPHFIPQYLKNNLFIGRHRTLSLLFVTQRPGQLNKNILSQCRHIFVGQLHEKNDLEYVSNFVGCETEKLINLEPRKFLYFSPGQEIKFVPNTL